MEPPKHDAKDPAVGVGLSLFMPGAGHLYAGRPVTWAVFLGVELWLVFEGRWGAFLALHAFQAVAAGGAVKEWNAKHALAAEVAVPPPPPPSARAGARRPSVPTVDAPVPPPPPPPSRPATLVLDADEFLVELQTAWAEHRSGTITARQFADRKWRALGAVRVEHREDGEALVAAAHELSAAGVLTSEEVGRLAARVAPA